MSHINKHTGKLVKSFHTDDNGVLVYPLTKNLFDVFIGTGFYNGLRMRKNKDGSYSSLKTWGTLPKNFSVTL